MSQHLIPSPKEFERYGYKFPKGWTDLKVELWCYRNGVSPKDGGLGVEGHFRRAFKMAWPKFIWHDWMEMLVTAFCNEKYITCIGHSRATKTFGTAHILYLDYTSDPFETWTSLTTVTFPGLQSRMWADLMCAVETAVFPCPFKITSNSGEMRLRVPPTKGAKKDEKYMIEGFATANTSDSAGRIQGKHANRRRLGLDEAQELPDAIWTAEVNAGTAPDFKSIRLANPVDKMSRFGLDCCEPEKGWHTIHDTDLFWRAKGGRLVLHFDGRQNFNHKLYFKMERGEITKAEYDAKKLQFMLTKEYADEIKATKGENSLEWWMYIVGFFPPDGLVSRAFPDAFIERMKPDITFDFQPMRFSVEDPAYENDDCVLHHFDVGKMRDGQWGVQCVGTEVIKPQMVEGGKTKDELIADDTAAKCKARGTPPENYGQDCTGNGRSCYSHLSRDWSRAVQWVEFGGKPSDRKMDDTSPATCDHLFAYFVDELWFRAALWAQSGRVGGIERLHANTAVDLAARRYTIRQNKRRLEDKLELKKRLGRSPDFGDAFVILFELLARRGIMPNSSKGGDSVANDMWAAARARAVKVCKTRHTEPTFAH
jgi:hypothetical protein